MKFIAHDRLLRVWTVAFITLEIGWISLQTSLPVLVVRHYHANPHDLGFIFAAFGVGAVVGAAVAYRLVVRMDALTMVAGAFTCQVVAMWGLILPGPWFVPATTYAVAGFFVSLVNTPSTALKMRRIPRKLRPQVLSVSGTGTSIGAPATLVAIGWALSRFDPRHVMTIVLCWQTASIAVIVASAIAERSWVRAASVDSPA